MRRRLALLLLVASLGTGCFGSMFQSDADAPELFRLSAPSSTAIGTALPLAVSVARPRAASSLDTERIAVMRPGSAFDYYAGARWSDTAPQMVQQLLVATLAAEGGFAAAVAAPSRVPTDLLVDLELRHFEAVYADARESPSVRVELQASLVDTRKGTRLATFESAADVPASANSRGAVVAAFDRAAGEVVREVAHRVRAAAAGPRP
jgi:cholesterol transport system auxiliary component